MKKSMADRLAFVTPASVVSTPLAVENTISDLERILALPSRPPVDCTRDPVTKLYQPATQALIEVVTDRYSRGPRVSCACRPRRVTRHADGARISILRILPESEPQESPIVINLAAFVADNRASAAEIEAARAVQALKPGDSIDLPAADGTLGHRCVTMLNAVQAWFLREIRIVGGGLGFCGVGSGKTMLNLLAPLAFDDCGLAVLVIEPKQRQHYKSQYLRLREHFRVSSIIHDDNTGHTVPGTPPLHLISYSVLSRTVSSKLLENRNPATLILDEAHRACGDSAINKRVKRFIADKIRKREEAMLRGEPVPQRAVRLVVSSGTLESKSVLDTQMLAAYSLGKGSPMPIDPDEAKAWSMVIDTSRQPDRKSKTAKALQRAFAGGEFEEEDLATSIADLLVAAPEKRLRQGFQKRRSETLGVISASASSVNAALYVTKRKAPDMPEIVRKALTEVRMNNISPAGDDLIEKIEQIACARQIACGFYSYWAFPKHPCTCVQPVTPGSQRCDECKLIEDWYAKRKLYAKELRSKLLKGEAELDSPQLCYEAARRFWNEPTYEGDLPKWDSEHWRAWAEIEDRVQYEERVKWIGHDTPEAKDPATHPGYFLVRDAVDWALSNKGVVWFQSVAFGRKVAEMSGLPYFNGGPGAEERLRAETGKRSIICSIKAMGAGIDGLQEKFCDQLIAEIPASNATQQGFEQVFGRLHREGQKSDVVTAELYLHTEELRDAYRKAVAQAEFNEAMTKNRQMILFADRDFDI